MTGAPAMAVIDYARKARIDLILIGTHGRTGLGHFVMGSVAEKIVRLAPCPVLTLKQPEHEFVRPDALQTVAHA
jgi:nucleotide-binding universal stress UspA family protein